MSPAEHALGCLARSLAWCLAQDPAVLAAFVLLGLGAIPTLVWVRGLLALGGLAKRLRSQDPEERIGALVDLVMDAPELYPHLAPRLNELIAMRVRP